MLQKKIQNNIIQFIFKFLINSWSFWVWKNKSILQSYKSPTDTDKVYAKDPYEAKYQLLINKQESAA